ncbi:winged helix-turn-helix domain-containing protein [Rhizobium sp. RHZ01]|uniref:winged helix-turn-helix domain-containing protein n=1 Tax=Rhizobium sp. RHZ01 TaxID=2769304 RepID=UPI00177EADFF|nr:winged helix-turn-helix domain-containing protein [Rhizobium sp. RHZ01]MBD9448902.1 winged helix-turn-helix transcriptional regulator [Rhizobium sp. RHZ01]
MTNYRDWLEGHKEASRARGGRSINPPSRVDEGYFIRAEREGWSHIRNCIGWKHGEIVNPITGEIATKCLTITKLADHLNTTSPKLIDQMEMLRWVDRVLSVESVPMICAPDLRKPRYLRRPVATRLAIEGGYCIPITVSRSIEVEERRISMILITPDGQKLLSTKLGHVPRGDKARDIVKHFLEEGRTQAAIVELTGYSQQSVSYHVRRLKSAA